MHHSAGHMRHSVLHASPGTKSHKSTPVDSHQPIVTPSMSVLHDKLCFASKGTLHHACRCPSVLSGDCAHSTGVTRQRQRRKSGDFPPLPSYPPDAHLQHTSNPGQWAPHRRTPEDPSRCVVFTQLNPLPVHSHTDHARLRRKLSTDLQTRRRHSADTSRALIVLLTTRFNTTTAVSDDVNKTLRFLVRFCIGEEPLALILSSYLID